MQRASTLTATPRHVERARQRLHLPVAALDRRRHDLDSISGRDRAPATPLAVADESSDAARARHRHEPRRQRERGERRDDDDRRARRRSNTVAAERHRRPRSARYTLTAAQGTWTGIGNAYTYQWQRSTAASGLDQHHRRDRRRPTRSAVADEGTTLAPARHRDQPRRHGERRQRGRPPRSQAAAPVNTAAPTITGTAQRAATLTATQRHVERHRQHLRLPVAALARRRHHVDEHRRRDRDHLHARPSPTRADVCACSSPPTNPDGTASAASAATGAVPARRRSTAPRPTITGTRSARVTLDRDERHLERPRQHLRLPVAALADGGTTWANITGATARTYTLGVADEGAQVRVLVTATNPDGTRERGERADRGRAGAPPVNTAAPTISGTAQRGVHAHRHAGHVERRSATPTPTSGSAPATAASPGRPSPARPARRTRSASATRAPSVRVLVTATNPDGTRSAASAADRPGRRVAAGEHGTLPTISGTLSAPSTLTATHGHLERRRQRLRLPVAALQRRRRRLDEHHRRDRGDLHAGPGRRGPHVRVLVTATNPDAASSPRERPTRAGARRPAGEHARCRASPGRRASARRCAANPAAGSPAAATFTYDWQSAARRRRLPGRSPARRARPTRCSRPTSGRPCASS